jgi:hypothetical protein
VPDRDDDIIEDYEEVQGEESQHVESATGGPVKQSEQKPRPANRVMGPPPGKGKISRKTAKRIWIISIAVCLLGVGAVAADLIFDPLQRHVKPPEPTAQHPVQQRPQRQQPKRQELTEKQRLARQFGRAAWEKSREMQASRAYDFAMTAEKHAREAIEEARLEENSENEEKWIDAWVKWYNASYALELFKHKWPFDDTAPGFPALSRKFDEYRDFELMSDELLESDDMRAQFAAYVLYAQIQSRVDALRPSVRSDRVESVVHGESPEIEAARNRQSQAVEGNFDEEDLAYVNRPPRDPETEPAPYE